MGIQDAKETGEGGGGGLMNRLVAAEALTQEGRKKLTDATCMFRSDTRRFVVSKAARAREREVGRPFVPVQGEAQPALQTRQRVVPEDVRIFREVFDRLGRESFRSRSRLSIACSSERATPPPPNLLPTRF